MEAVNILKKEASKPRDQRKFQFVPVGVGKKYKIQYLNQFNDVALSIDKFAFGEFFDWLLKYKRAQTQTAPDEEFIGPNLTENIRKSVREFV